METRLKKTGWKDVTIDEYYEIVDILENKYRSEVERNVALLAVLCDTDEDEIYDLTLPEVHGLMKRCGWLKDFKFDRKFSTDRITLKGREYDVCVDLQKMTISQYIDFQTYWGKRDLRRYYGNILACFIVPRGKKYCEGYNAIDLGYELRKTMSISMANAICFFFLQQLRSSITATRLFFRWMMRRLRRMKPTEEIQARMDELQELMNRTSDTDGLRWSMP